MDEKISKFVDAARQSLRQGTFVKLNLGNYKGADEHLQKILTRLIETKKGRLLSFTYRYKTRDVVKNYPFDEAIDSIAALLGNEFFAGLLSTTAADYQLEISKKGRTRLASSKPSASQTPSATHDRRKKSYIDPHSRYLNSLGITTSDGKVKDKQQDKWRQINKFVETVWDLYDNSALAGRNNLSIVDMGSGKGYLTFAVYDYFRNALQLETTVTGIESRCDLVDFCNKTAAENNFLGLRFVQGTIAASELSPTDILIALHACDTATDDALFKGIRAQASIIITSPCCHKEIRPQIKPPGPLKEMLKHGILLEQTAESVTDSIRASILEGAGYKTSVFEFISPEHTPKNNMISGTLRSPTIKPTKLDKALELMDFYGIRRQRLADLMAPDAVE